MSIFGTKVQYNLLHLHQDTYFESSPSFAGIETDVVHAQVLLSELKV